MKDFWYPLIFEPLYETASWGGGMIGQLSPELAVESDLPASIIHMLVDAEGTSNVVANGELAGKTLRELVSRYPENLVSFRQHPDKPFPLRIRYLDVGRDRPLMVHSNDENGQPLSKFWYVMAADPDAELIAGISYRGTASQFVSRIGRPELKNQLESFSAQPGDAYYITPGRVHSIGSGNLIFAVEQASDNSQMVAPLDFDTDAPKVGRDIMQLINFIDRSVPRIRRDGGVTQRNRKLPIITTSPSFLVDELRLVEKYFDRDSKACQILTAAQGNVVIEGGGRSVPLHQGGCCLIPASMSTFSIIPDGPTATVLRTALRID